MTNRFSPLLTPNVLQIASSVLYAIALLSPAIEAAEPTRTWRGWEVLQYGGLSLFSLDIAWLANPLYFLSVYLAKRRRDSALWMVGTALICALSSFFVRHLPSFDFGRGFNDDGAVVTNLDIGFYAWLGSIVLLMLSIVRPHQERAGSGGADP